jgi:hypothetical protein
MNFIDFINKNIPSEIHTTGDLYKAFVGNSDFTPSSIITVSDDYHCGALCDELEYVRMTSNQIVAAVSIDNAFGELLDSFIMSFINLPRRSSYEDDNTYASRFKAIVTQKTNYRRTTRWAIVDAIRELGWSVNDIQVIEPFDITNLYFQLRLTGTAINQYSLFLDSEDSQGYIDQYYVGGQSIGSLITYIDPIIRRIKAAGIDYDIMVVGHGVVSVTSDAIIDLPVPVPMIDENEYKAVDENDFNLVG